MSKNILLLPGDGIGPEIVAEAERVLDWLVENKGLDVTITRGLLGGCATDIYGNPYPQETKVLAEAADAILLGAVGGPKWEAIDRPLRPERGLLAIRSELDLFANLRPAMLYPQLAEASSLKPEVVSGLDIMIVRELTSGIYFGEPRGIATDDQGNRHAFNSLTYTEAEIERIGIRAFEIAMKRDKRVCSVDKANVLEVSELWREVMERVAKDYPEVELSHMYVDNAAMQLVRAPKQFDVIVADNLFGDILSDQASMLSGSIGMLPSASLNASGKGMYEPVHGSAPDIAGQGISNPLATILSLAMLLRYTLAEVEMADEIDAAVINVLDQGIRTADIGGSARTVDVGNAVLAALSAA